VRNIIYCCLARAQSKGSFGAMEGLQKLQRKRKVSKVRRYMGTRVFFGGERCVYINKGTRYREQIESLSQP